MKEQLLVARPSTVLVACVAMLFAFRNTGIMGKPWLVRNFWHPIIPIPLIAGILGIKVNKKSFLYSCIPGVLLTLLGRVISSEFGVLSLMMGTCGSTIFFCVHHILTVGKARSLTIPNVLSIINYIRNKILWILREWKTAARQKDLATFISYVAVTSIPLFIFFPMSNNIIYNLELFLKSLVLFGGYFISYNATRLSGKTLSYALAIVYCLYFSMHSSGEPFFV